MDTSDDPYNYVKGAFYEGRLLLPTHNWCQQELLSLEQDSKTGKIDHPATGTKDVADALAGVVWGLTTRRELWAHFGVPLITLPTKGKTQAGVKSPTEKIQ